MLLSVRPFDAAAQDEKERVWVYVDAVMANDISEASAYDGIIQSRCRREILDLGYTEVLPNDVLSWPSGEMLRPHWVLFLNVFELDTGFLGVISGFRIHRTHTNGEQAFVSGGYKVYTPRDSPVYLCQAAAAVMDEWMTDRLQKESDLR